MSSDAQGHPARQVRHVETLASRKVGVPFQKE